MASGYVMLENGMLLYWKRWVRRKTVLRYIALALAGKPLPRTVSPGMPRPEWRQWPMKGPTT
jgi:hypothetical protein